MFKLDPDSQSDLERRAAIGNGCIAVAAGELVDDFAGFAAERETFASDAVSDILTALYGPAGAHSLEGGLTQNLEAIGAARDLLARALDSYRGDAEDYTIA